jgi:hypothetical protein
MRIRFLERAIRAATIVVLAAAWSPALMPAAVAAEKDKPSALLTAAQWAKIVKRMDQGGDTRVLPFKVAQHLGLTKGAEVLTVHELAFEREGYQHGIYRSVDLKDARVILAFRTPDKRWTAFLTNTRFTFVSAIVWNAGEDPVPWPANQALPAFNNELGYWSVLADLF